MTAKTDEQFRAELPGLNTHYPDELELTTPYISVDKPISCICKAHGHEWTTTPRSLLKGSGCPHCSGRARNTHAGFLASLRERNTSYANGEFEVVGRYRSRSAKIECRCLREGCGREWKATAGSLLCGTGCPHCAKNGGSSRTQEFLAAALRAALGDAAVVSRDREAIGSELDIYIPGAKVAVEPGARRWHEEICREVATKAELCREKGIKLIGFTEGCGKEARPEGLPSDWGWYAQNLFYEPGRSTLRQIAVDIARECGSDCDFSETDWEAIALEAAKRATPRSLDELRRNLRLANSHSAEGELEVVGFDPSAKDSVRCKCNVCGHLWTVKTYSLLQGQGCPNYRMHPGWVSPKRLTHEEFMARLDEVNPHYDHGRGFEVLGRYEGNRKRIKCHCLRCGTVWEPIAGSLIRTKASGCPTCGHERTALARGRKA